MNDLIEALTLLGKILVGFVAFLGFFAARDATAAAICLLTLAVLLI